MSNIHGAGEKVRTAYGFTAAISIVIANMIGTGVFTSLGFQLAEIKSGFPILVLWAAGGLAAFCGALSYAELGAALPRSGGEYNFLTRIYHPSIGFVSGWISATIGFAAPVALAAITFGAYVASALSIERAAFAAKMLAGALIIALTILHGTRRRSSGVSQTAFTAFKIAAIVVFCAGAALLTGGRPATPLIPVAGDGAMIMSDGFAISLIYVSFAFAGWNAATYVSGETRNAQRTLPLILGLGTFVVALLYVGLNVAFLSIASSDVYEGKIEIAVIAAKVMFGEAAGAAIGLAMAALLVSTVSAMTIAGPRVLRAIGEDFAPFRSLAHVNEDGLPTRAIALQSAVALFFIATSTFEQVLVFTSFTIALNSFATVAGLFVLRWRESTLARPFRVPLFPVTPLIYLGLTGWSLAWIALDRPDEVGASAVLIAVGLAAYAALRRPHATK